MITIVVKAVVSFLSKSVGVIQDTALRIANAIRNNEALFPSVSPKADDGLIIINELVDARKNSNGTEIAKENIKTKLAAVKKLIRTWAPQVTKDANGVLEVLLKSGFENIKQRQPEPPVATPLIVKAKDTEKSGIITIRVPKVKYAKQFQYRFTKALNPMENDFTYLDPGTRIQVVGNLDAASTYYISCRAFGTHSASDWCDPNAYIVR